MASKQRGPDERGAAAVVGQIGAVKVDIVETGGVDVPTALLALAAFADSSASTRS
jgi:hypothetical protein